MQHAASQRQWHKDSNKGKHCLGMSIVAIATILVMQFRSFIPAAHILLGLLMGLGLMAFLLWALRIDINFYNMAIFAAVVGMGIDVAIHLFSHWQVSQGSTDSPLERVRHTLIDVGAPVTVSTVTTVAGYVGMLASYHPGIRSIGDLAVTGLLSCLVVALSIFPLYLVWLGEKQEAKRINS